MTEHELAEKLRSHQDAVVRIAAIFSGRLGREGVGLVPLLLDAAIKRIEEISHPNGIAREIVCRCLDSTGAIMKELKSAERVLFYQKLDLLTMQLVKSEDHSLIGSVVQLAERSGYMNENIKNYLRRLLFDMPTEWQIRTKALLEQ